MLYLLSQWLQPYWGPFRLFRSHMVLMGCGAFLAAILVWFFLPRLVKLLPVDRGKAVKTATGKVEAVVGGSVSAGKPTGAGFPMAMLLVPVFFLFFPIYALESFWDLGVILSVFGCMLAGYLDDRSDIPWSGLRKGLFDILFALGATTCLCHCSDVSLWLPFTTVKLWLPPWAYIPLGAFFIFFAINITNCSDGIDGLAGLLTLLSLITLTILLYVVIGHREIADYLNLPHSNSAAKWAIMVAIFAGAMGAYLWFNCYPSSLLMGDAGSRMFGMVLGIASIATGNFLILFVVATVLIVDGGGGLVKLAILRLLKACGRPVIKPLPGEIPTILQRFFFSIIWPLHDHLRKVKGWSGQQVVMRFLLLQALLLPLLLLIFLKVR